LSNRKIEKKNGQAPFIAPLNFLPLLCSHPGGVQKELVVKDLPATKIEKFAANNKLKPLYRQSQTYFWYLADNQE